jgi:hypothetical protein
LEIKFSWKNSSNASFVAIIQGAMNVLLQVLGIALNVEEEQHFKKREQQQRDFHLREYKNEEPVEIRLLAKFITNLLKIKALIMD